MAGYVSGGLVSFGGMVKRVIEANIGQTSPAFTGEDVIMVLGSDGQGMSMAEVAIWTL